MKNLLSFFLKEKVELLEQPENDAHGDFALPCFSFVKELRQSPASIAAGFKKSFEEMQKTQNNIIDRMEVAGGYLNFFLNRAVVAKFIAEELGKNNFGRNIFKGRTALLEHTSINPNASPHIGRARNAFIGDAIARLLKFLGADIEVHYFVNDIGKQISLLVYVLGERKNIMFDELLAEYIKANELLEQKPDIEKIVFEQLEKLEHGDKDMQARFRRVVDICVKGQCELFNRLDINYDFFDYESDYVTSGRVVEVLNLLKKTERLFEDENGRLVMNLEGYKVAQTMLPLTRGDKTSLYPLRDICYSIDKACKKTDMNIIVLGEDQIMYLQQLNAVLDILGYKGAQGIHYSFVLLSDGKMSTRAGNVVLLSEIMEKAVERQKNLKSPQAAHVLGYGAVKYAILKCSANKNVMFDWDAVLNMQGDSSLYLQYCYARISSLLRKDTKFKEQGSDSKQMFKSTLSDFDIFNDDTAWKLLKKVYEFPQMLLSVVHKGFQVSEIAGYLFSMAQTFSRWYADTKIADTDNVWLAGQIGKVIKNGLWILGIDVVEEM